MSAIVKRSLRHPLFQFGLLAFSALLILVIVGLSLRNIVHSTLEKEAVRKAELWAQEFLIQATALGFLDGEGEIFPAQFEEIEVSTDLGEIFRFNFFSPTGELKFVSDDFTFPTFGETSHSSTAQVVYSSGQNDISVKYGQSVPNRPETFAEAYIPATLPTGVALGVIEVYVDLSPLAATLDGLVNVLGALVTSGIVAVFLISASIMVFRHHKLNNAQAREIWLTAILNHAPFEVVIKDNYGKILALSRNVIDELNLQKADFIGRTTADFLPDDIAQQYMIADQEVVRTGQATQKEVIETINGSTRYSLSSKFPLTGSNGEVLGVCSITNDITDLKFSELKLAHAQKMETVGQLSGGIAHDFNNLLSVVSGSIQLLEHSKDKKERDKLTQVALRAIEHGSALTNQMLALNQRSPLISKPTDLNSSLAEFEGLFSNILPANIDFTVISAPVNINIVVDASMFQNALLNIALNSQESMPNGGRLNISAGIVNAPIEFPNEFSLEGKCAAITIIDNGAGISEDVLSLVFDPFYTTREIGKGSGLGLSMVKGFIEQSNGVIQLDSNTNFGTTVKIFLPMSLEGACVVGASQRRLAPLPANEGKGTVLVVEDNEQLLDIIAQKLEKDGFSVVLKQSGDEALEVLKGVPNVQLVLSDLIMPGYNQGIDVLRKAKSLHPPLPVVLMSGYADRKSTNEKAFELADKFMQKPLALAELSDVIEYLISEKIN